MNSFNSFNVAPPIECNENPRFLLHSTVQNANEMHSSDGRDETSGKFNEMGPSFSTRHRFEGKEDETTTNDPRASF